MMVQVTYYAKIYAGIISQGLLLYLMPEPSFLYLNAKCDIKPVSIVCFTKLDNKNKEQDIYYILSYFCEITPYRYYLKHSCQCVYQYIYHFNT